MVVSCSAYKCNQKFEKKSKISFHCFPSDPELQKKWLINMKRETFQPSKYSKLCSKHFERSCFDKERFGNPFLLKGSVPTIFEFPEDLNKKFRHRKPPKRRSSPRKTSSLPVTKNNDNSTEEQVASTLMIQAMEVTSSPVIKTEPLFVESEESWTEGMEVASVPAIKTEPLFLDWEQSLTEEPSSKTSPTRDEPEDVFLVVPKTEIIYPEVNGNIKIENPEYLDIKQEISTEEEFPADHDVKQEIDIDETNGFPWNRPEILKKWVIAVRRKDWTPSKYSFICSDHFSEASYMFGSDRNKPLLKEDAVPEIFNFADHLRQPPKKRRRVIQRQVLVEAMEVALTPCIKTEPLSEDSEDSHSEEPSSRTSRTRDEPEDVFLVVPKTEIVYPEEEDTQGIPVEEVGEDASVVGEDEATESRPSPAVALTPIKLQNKIKHENEFFTTALETLQTVKESRVKKLEAPNRDDCDIFGELVSSELRQIKDSITRETLKFNIHKLIFEAKISQCSGDITYVVENQ